MKNSLIILPLAILLWAALTVFSVLLLRRVVYYWLIRREAVTWAPRSVQGILLLFLVPACLFSIGAAIGTRRPIFGLVVFPIGPFLLNAIRVQKHRVQERDVIRSAISFLEALRGLVRVGMSLPAALFHLTKTLKAPFSAELERSLLSFDRGRSLSQCLNSFRGKYSSGMVGLCLASLELAYRNGLPILPLLDRTLPLMEREWDVREKMRSVRKTALGQLTLALCVPWMLTLTMAVFQPETLRHWMSGNLRWIMLPSFGWEGLGIYLVWQCSKFW